MASGPIISRGAAAYVFHTASIGLSAFLLFLVQPMIAKMILPLFGGGAAIWLTGIIFFQLLLFAGYALSNWLITRIGPRRHLLFQAAITLCSLFSLPFAVDYGSAPLPPPAGIFFLLFATVGLPYFVLSTTSPVAQYWLAHDTAAKGRNPYLLYAVSNAGSLAGLFAYPLGVETAFSTGMQSALWAAFYACYAALMAAGGWCAYRNSTEATGEGSAAREAVPPISGARARWTVQAMAPSAALIIITHYLTLDVVNFPLLWVLPLGLYLLSFVLCFSLPALSRPGQGRALAALLPLLALMLLHGGRVNAPFTVKIAVALAALFSLAMFFHGNLEREKPHKGLLTSFYMYVSLGGLLGSFLTGIAAPLIFKTTFEFNLVILAAIFLIALSDLRMGKTARLAFNGALIASLAIGYGRQEQGWGTVTVDADRSFYGSYRVEETRGQGGAFRQLVAGTHIHGLQRVGSNEPLAYYHRRSGVGSALDRMKGFRRVAGIGLGAGAIAAYGKPGEQYDFYELDPLVTELAQRHFSYLRESAATVNIFPGDGRLNLRAAPDGAYNLIVVDAFTSGSIPAHLITPQFVREAFAKLAPGGSLMYNISNRHIDLLPVLQGDAALLGLRIARHVAPADEAAGAYTAVWVALASGEERIAQLAASDPQWSTPRIRPVFWSDDRSDVWTLLDLGVE